MIPKTIDRKPIPCVSLSVNQSIIPLSNATMEVLKEDALPIRTYVEIATPNGVTEMYRTRQPQESYTSGLSTIQLDHAICEVGDFLIQDAIEEEMTVREAMVAVFNHYRGDKWQLGTFTATETVTLDCDYDNVLETMLSILEQVPKYYLTFDFSTSPWTVSVAQKSDTVTAEGRMSRNIANDAVKTDDKDQCTRVYVKGLPKPSGREEDENAIGYMDADAATIAQYGIIEKETGSGNLTEAQATRIAQAYLEAHKHPKRSVEIDGDDLSEITGESLDSFVCGKKFRLAVPEDSLIIEDYITKVSFQDALNSSVANVIIGDEQDAAINFLQAQASSTKASRGARKKQDKENESFEKSFAKVDEHGAILEQAGMKLDSHGMIVYARDNVNNIGSILDMTASEIRSEVAAGDLQLRSEISQTASAIRLSVDNSLSDVHSSITQTAEQIYSEVHTSNSAVYSYINQTSTSIQSVVADVNADLHSEILQTQSMIRSAVWTANSQVYSYVDQTASYILDHVGERTGARVFTGMDEPVDSPDNPITPGDLWLEGNYINFWDDADFQFVSYDPDDPEYDWTQLRGAKLHVWKDGEWQLAEDGTTIVEDTDLRRTKDQINLVAHNLIQTDGELRSNIARIDVKADKITSTVNERIADVGSRITQTAYQIRSEVHSASSQLYSAIEQTATSIRAYVVDEVNDLGSEILQTASQIRSEVHAAKSTLYSYVDQTATYIRSEVADTANGLSSAITQTASQIRAEVNDKAAGLSSRITQTASQIRSEVNAANSTVYSSITQTASQIRSEVSAAQSTIYSSITQTASQIRLEVKNTASGLQSQITQNADNIELKVSKNGVISSINQTAEAIQINASKINLNGYVTASNFSTVLANLASAHINKLYVDTNIYAPNGLSMYANGVWQLSLSRSGNTYTLKETKLNGDERTVGSFSRAVSSFIWGGGSGKINVTALPQNQTQPVNVSVDGTRNITSNGTYTYKAYYENADGDDVETGASVSVTVAVPSSTPTIDAIANYDTAGNIITNRTISSSLTLVPWVKVNGIWHEGTGVTITPQSRTDRGSGWSCSISGAGVKSVTLMKTFGAGETIPWTSGNSYHLYV